MQAETVIAVWRRGKGHPGAATRGLAEGFALASFLSVAGRQAGADGWMKADVNTSERIYNGAGEHIGWAVTIGWGC